MPEKQSESGHLTTYLESNTEAGQQLSRYGYLWALLGLVAAVVLAVLVLLWLALGAASRVIVALDD